MGTFQGGRSESGATLSWAVTIGGHGQGGTQQILGDQGSIEGFGSRGSSTRLRRHGAKPIEYDQLIRQTPDFELEPLAAHFFPDTTTVGDGAVDWKLIALEQFELAEAILHGRRLEVDGEQGLKDVAAIYSIFEAARAGRSVTMAEVESGQVYEYQREIDQALGLA